jgi:hypothetical protein
MPGKDHSIEEITQLAVQDVADAIAAKIGRELSADEFGGVAKIVGTEHFWARAEEMLMFVRYRSEDEVANAVTELGIRYRDWRASQPP